MSKPIRFLAVLAALMLLTASLVGAAAPQSQKGSYLVGLKPGASAQALANAGVEVLGGWPSVNAVHIRATAAAAAALAKNPNVEYVEEDAVRTVMGYTDGTYTWGLQAVKAPEAWALGATGANIKVCVLDTGIDYNHPEFYRNGVSIIKGSANFVSDGHPDATDGHGHGTHVAGTVAGQLNASGSYIGVAPGIDLYVARVLGDDGSGSSSGIMNGVQWCFDQGARIASMSLGGSFKSRTEDRFYTDLYNKGLLTIAAAGNGGNNRLSYPAGYTNVVSVAAVDSNLNWATFSQYNSDVELAGPGVSVLSSVIQGTGLKGSAAEDSTPYTAYPLEYSPNGSVTGPLVECGLADSTSSCTGVPTSGAWIALIDRGSVTFADKVNNVMAQGASAAIIANNDTANPDDPGSFTLGAQGNWIPTVSVSYNSGVAIRNGGLGTGTVEIGPWDYAYYQGTSMATPHASAVAALAWSANPALTNVDIRSVLQCTAQDLGAAGRDDYFGYGLVQADAAVNLAMNYTPCSTSGGGGGGGGGKGNPNK
ncbi:MAG: S8 family serine peptidase [Bacillota bacterium]